MKYSTNHHNVNFDSGGPVVCRRLANEGEDEADRRWILAGVVAFGDNYDEEDKSIVLADVAQFIQWIR